MRIVDAESGKYHHIRRISFYSVNHDEFNPAPVTGNILLRDFQGGLPAGSYLIPELGGVRVVIRIATDTNEFVIPQSLHAYQETKSFPFTPGAPSAGSNP